MRGQLYLEFFDPDLGTPSLEARRAFLDPSNPVSPYFGFIGNRRAVDRLIRIDFEALGRHNHVCNDLNIAFIGQAGCGKAQPLNSRIYTPIGPKTMGQVKCGDIVCTPTGRAEVIGVYPQGKKPVFRIHFKDGATTECCDEHLWCVENIHNKWKDGFRVVSTKQLIESCKAGGRSVYAVPVTNPVDFDHREVSIPPYLLAVLLGEGNFTNNTVRFATGDKEIIENLNKLISEDYTITKPDNYDYRIVKAKRSNLPNFYMEALRSYKLWGLFSHEKFIPEDYLYNTVENRFVLLRGLMDTDGFVSKNGGVYYYTTSKQLANDVKHLVESLGGLGNIYQKQSTYTYNGEKRIGRICYIVGIKHNNPEDLFSLSRKKVLTKKRAKYKVKRIIASIELVGQKECQCILVNDKEHLYLTDSFIVTHNTELARRHAKANQLPLVELSPKSIKSTHDIFRNMKRKLAEVGMPLVQLGRIDRYVPPPMNVFIDEVHALAAPVVDGLLKATEHNDGVLVTERGVTVDCKNVHWMIATTERGKLFDAFDTRFTKCILNLYTKDEMAKIVQVHNPDWDMGICRLVAHFCGRVPREALAFAREMQLEHNMNPYDSWNNVAHAVAEDNEIDPFGMTYKRLAILKALGRGPVAEKRLPIIAGCKSEELDKFILPWLLATTDDQEALVTVSCKGYSITEAGIKELDLRKIPNEGKGAMAA
jgi:hypothetical protein